MVEILTYMHYISYLKIRKTVRARTAAIMINQTRAIVLASRKTLVLLPDNFGFLFNDLV